MDMKELLLTVAVIGGLTLLLSLYARRKMSRSWRGRVEKITSFSERDPHFEDSSVSRQMVRVFFRTEKGKTIKMDFEKGHYEKIYPQGLAEGAEVEKQPGKWYPLP